ncbi:MAG TPA: hypothetical protein PLU30_24505 [Verrucomicrobiae bacterium]|nr:hypothetical protein [Verrucomicrobiae bacterium]
MSIRVWRAPAGPARPCIKRAFLTWQAAALALIKIWKMSDRRVPKRHRYRERCAYRCYFCGLWHLSSKARRRA